MSIILYGVTSGGTSVPIEVTDEGKLVVDTSKFPTDEFIKQGDDIEAGSITAAGGNFNVVSSGAVEATRIKSERSDNTHTCFEAYKTGESEPSFKVTAAGSITAAGGIGCNSLSAESETNNTWFRTGSNLYGIEYVFAAKDQDANKWVGGLQKNGKLVLGTELTDIKLTLEGSTGAAGFVGGKAGFTVDGELYFYSRGTRYKAVVQGGNVAAEPFTRSMELQERAAKLREPKTQDIVPED